MEAATVIKKCVNPYCDAIFHNVPAVGRHTRCPECGYSGALITINEKTYQELKWIHFQYDYQEAIDADERDDVADFCYPESVFEMNRQLKLDF